MKLSVLTVPFAQQSLVEVLPYLKELGVEAVELGCGGVTNDAHCKPAQLLKDDAACEQLKQLLAENEMTISALSCHGNPVHPDAARAKADHEIFLQTVELAQILGVDTVVTFSGCPGDGHGAVYPNWVVMPWPNDFVKILDYQWNEVLIPYWRDAACIAKQHSVKIALEMHPGFCVYNTETMLRLRKATDDAIGANFDPSHLFWQGMDAAVVVRELGEAIYFVHMKDCRINPDNMRKNGILDTKSYGDIKNRSWLFRTIGYGNDTSVWRDIISELRTVGYDGAISIEHEDILMSDTEGIEKSVAFVKNIMIKHPRPKQAFWT